MPYKMVQDHADCPSDNPVAVVKDDETEEVMGCHASEEEAKAQIAALMMEEGTEDTEDQAVEVPSRWKGTIGLEETRTSDDREIAAGATTWRELPLPLMFQPANNGHDGARPAGSITSITRVGNELQAEGTFDLDSDDGREAARLVSNRTLRWVSMDPTDGEVQVIQEGDCAEMDLEGGDGTVVVDSATDCHFIERMTELEIAGATLLPFPAFADAQIEAVLASGRVWITPNPVEFNPMLAPTAEPAETVWVGNMSNGIVAAGPLKPPADWFSDPKLDGPTPLTVTEDGRVFGHAAQWGVCHTGITGKCVLAPRSTTAYSAFMTGGFVETDEGPVRVGHLTLGCDHPDLALQVDDVQRHYSMSGSVWANVCAGEDEHGVWVAGSVVPTVTDEQLSLAKSLALSGDWRRIAGAPGLELVAALSVPVPGFPIGLAASGALVRGPRAHVKDGEVLALVAAGVVTQCFECQKEEPSIQTLANYERRLRRLEAGEALALRTRVKVPVLRDRVHG